MYGPAQKTSTAQTDLTGQRLYLHDSPVAVDVYITTYGEDLDTIARTVSAAVAMHVSM